MANCRETCDMAQQTEQLIKLMGYHCDKGDFVNARKIANKLIQADSARLRQLATIDIGDANYLAVMNELRQIEFLTK